MDFQVGTNLDVAMAEVRGRVESVRGQLTVELASNHRGANYSAARLRIDGNFVEASEVD